MNNAGKAAGAQPLTMQPTGVWESLNLLKNVENSLDMQESINHLNFK